MRNSPPLDKLMTSIVITCKHEAESSLILIGTIYVAMTCRDYEVIVIYDGHTDSIVDLFA